jgi:hypothetical protein
MDQHLEVDMDMDLEMVMTLDYMTNQTATTHARPTLAFHTVTLHTHTIPSKHGRSSMDQMRITSSQQWNGRFSRWATNEHNNGS